MQQIFSLKTSVILYSFFALLGLLIHYVFSCIMSDGSLINSILPGLGIGTMILGFLGSPWMFGWIWQDKLVQKFTFTFIGGEWVGELKSNWAVVKAMHDHAVVSKKLNVDDISFAKMPSTLVKVRVTITAGLFRTSMKLAVIDSHDSRESRSKCMQLVKDADGKESIYYVYKQETHQPVNTDEGQHVGAAELEVKRDADGNVYLEGLYWTARSWQRGLNTAGVIKLVRQ